MNSLKELLPQDAIAPFLEKHFTRLPFASAKSPTEIHSYLHWEAVEKIIDSQKSILRIVKDGKMVKDYTDLSYAVAKDFYQKGHTLLVKNAERADKNFKQVAQDFSASFRTEVDVQLYCTPEGHNAFDWHYDVEEVFIFQSKGSKEYSIRPNTIHPNPLVSSITKDLGYEKEKSDVVVKVLLQEGDWLYIPSGWWHIARTQSESMHISVGLMPRSAVDIVSFLPSYLAQFELWRRRMPVHAQFSSLDEEVSFYQEAMMKLGNDLKEKMSQREFVEKFISHSKRDHFTE